MKKVVTVNEIRSMLRKTDWEDYTSNVVREVAKKADKYREADAQALGKASQCVFV